MDKRNIFKLFRFTIDRAHKCWPADYEVHSKVFWGECEEQDGWQEDYKINCLRELESVMLNCSNSLSKKELKKLKKKLAKASKIIENA